MAAATDITDFQKPLLQWRWGAAVVISDRAVAGIVDGAEVVAGCSNPVNCVSCC